MGFDVCCSKAKHHCLGKSKCCFLLEHKLAPMLLQLAIVFGLGDAALGKQDIPGQGGSTALPAASGKLFENEEAVGSSNLGSCCWQWCRVQRGPSLGQEAVRVSFLEQKGPESSSHRVGMVGQGELCCGVQFSLLQWKRMLQPQLDGQHFLTISTQQS